MEVRKNTHLPSPNKKKQDCLRLFAYPDKIQQWISIEKMKDGNACLFYKEGGDSDCRYIFFIQAYFLCTLTNSFGTARFTSIFVPPII